MKELYINNKRVIIDSENTYFPLSYKINDLEDVNIIGVPVSKTIDIPRCPVNDEIFGHIGELTRMVISDVNNLVSVSFNQSKKAYYQLLNDSELISEGTLSIVDVNEINYSIILYDILIDKIESIAGNTDTGEGFLNELDIKLVNNSIFSINAYATNVKDLNDANSEVRPCVNIKEYDSTGTNSYILVDGVKSIHTLPTELTPVQFQSLKPYEFEYSMPLSTVIRSINNKYNLITYEDDLSTLFDEVHFNCGSPKHNLIIEDHIVSQIAFPDPYFFGKCYPDYNGDIWYNSDWSTSPIKKIPFTANITNLGNKNGNYYLEVPLNIEVNNRNIITGAVMPTKSLVCNVFDWDGFISDPYDNNQAYCDNYYGGNHPNAAPYGTYMGSVWVTISLVSYNGTSKLYASQPINTEVRLIKGVNVTETLNLSGEIIKLNIQIPNGTIPLSYDFYTKTQNINITNYIEFNFSNFGHNNGYTNSGCILLNSIVASSYNEIYLRVKASVGDIKVRYKSSDFRCGDILNGQTLFPKIPIKDFLIETAKYFNLGIKMVNGKLNLHYKRYYKTDELLKVNSVNSININNFNFSKLTLKNEVSNNKWIEEYNTYTKKTYGEKTINTGYNIKVTNKDIEFVVSTPAIIRDTANWAYDIFAGYFNGGYSKHLNGVTEGLEDKLVFGYPLLTTDDLYVTDDSEYEAGLISSTIIPTETNFVLGNSVLNFDTTSGLYTFNNQLVSLNCKLLNNHFTLVPYKFDSNFNIIKSVEINKPLYNYANITDALYTENVTLYTRYHQRYIQDMYNVNTHILDVNVFIDGLIDVYKIFNYNNSNYIISEVPEYDPTTPDLYDIKLLRVNDTNNYTDFYGKITRTIPTVLTNTVSSIGYTNFLLGGIIENTGNSTILGKGLLIANPGETLDYNNYDQRVILGVNDSFFSYINNLTPSTNYIYRAYAYNQIGYGYGEIKQASTIQLTTPLVALAATDQVYALAVALSSEVMFQGQSAVTSRGFCWDYAYNDNPTLADNFIEVGSGIGVFNEVVSGLTPATDYTVVAYATNSQGTSYSELVSSFTTVSVVPTMSLTATRPFVNSLSLTGTVDAEGGTITERGFVLSTTTQEPTVGGINCFTLIGAATSPFSTTFTINPSTNHYYIRSYAINEAGVGHSVVTYL